MLPRECSQRQNVDTREEHPDGGYCPSRASLERRQRHELPNGWQSHAALRYHNAVRRRGAKGAGYEVRGATCR